MRTMELMIAVQLVPKPRTRVGPRRTMRIWARTVRSRRVPKKPNVLTNEKIEQNTSFNLFLEFCFMLKHTCAMRVFRINPYPGPIHINLKDEIMFMIMIICLKVLKVYY